MAINIHLRLYEELNDFLPPDRRKRRFDVRLDGRVIVRWMLEYLGVPEDHVELILVNGHSVGFSHKLKENDFVGICPVFESFDVAALIRTRRKPLRQTRFMASAGLCDLARHLRLLGFDTLVSRLRSQDKIVCAAEKGKRILLTRDTALVKHPAISRAYFVRAAKPKQQVEEVLTRFDLYNSIHSPQVTQQLAAR
jgi:uncharacterized protein